MECSFLKQGARKILNLIIFLLAGRTLEPADKMINNKENELIDASADLLKILEAGGVLRFVIIQGEHKLIVYLDTDQLTIFTKNDMSAVAPALQLRNLISKIVAVPCIINPSLH